MIEKQIIFESEYGDLYLAASERGLTYLCNKKKKEVECIALESSNSFLKQAVLELNQYFQGCRENFSVPLDFKGTEFQKSVWTELMKIPFGETRSYKDIASKVGRNKAVRAVGSANGKNPIWIIIPCHRVIASSGSIAGYAGGVSMKRNLLSQEGITL